MDSSGKKFIFIIILVAVLGFVGGVAGELWVNSFLLPSPYLSFKNYSDLSARIDELIKGREGGKSFNIEDAAAEKITRNVRPAIVSIYRQKNFLNSAAGLTDSDFLGDGAIITNDGWVVTSSAVASIEKPAYLIVTNERQISEVTEVKIYKKVGIAFLRAKLNNSPVVEFISRENLIEGQTVFAFGKSGGIFVSNIKNVNYSEGKNVNDLVHSSEDFYKFILLKDRLAEEFIGGPVVTAGGKMLGVAKNAAGEITPINHFAEVMKGQYLSGEWESSYLGITFYDLSEILNPQILEKQGAKIKSIKPDSPALSVLFPGDIILSVEADELSAGKNLTEVIAEYGPGSSIKLLISRNSEKKQLEVKLAKKAQ